MSDDGGPRDVIPRRLVVFSGVVHYTGGKRLVAHRGFVREIDLWSRIFDRVLVVGPSSTASAAEDAVAYGEPNTEFTSLGPPPSTHGFAGKLRLLQRAPQWVFRARSLLERDDVVMARGPDSIGFLGWILTRFTSRPRFAKYAGPWEPFSGEAWGWRLQRWFYRSRGFGGPVMIYGTADRRLGHLIPFFTASVSAAEWELAGGGSRSDPGERPFRLLFVGRLRFLKGVDVALTALRVLRDRGLRARLTVVGEGPEQHRLEAEARALGVADWVAFEGWVGWEALVEHYRAAHVLIHPSRNEGFGKVLLEALTFGLPVVASDVGVSRVLLDPPRCGALVRPGDAGELASAIFELASEPDRLRLMSKNARSQAGTLTLDHLEARYREFVRSHVDLTPVASDWDGRQESRHLLMRGVD
jgi:glycosyltransferase involved in cell wall biosynthesis